MRAAPHELAPEMELDGIVTRGEEWHGHFVRHITLPLISPVL